MKKISTIGNRKQRGQKKWLLYLLSCFFPLNAGAARANTMAVELHCYNYGSKTTPLTLETYIFFAQSKLNEVLEIRVKTAFEILKEAAGEADDKLRELPHIHPYMWKRGTPSCSEEDYFHEPPCKDLKELGEQIVDSIGYKEEVRRWQSTCRVVWASYWRRMQIDNERAIAEMRKHNSYYVFSFDLFLKNIGWK